MLFIFDNSNTALSFRIAGSPSFSREDGGLSAENETVAEACLFSLLFFLSRFAVVVLACSLFIFFSQSPTSPQRHGCESLRPPLFMNHYISVGRAFFFTRFAFFYFGIERGRTREGERESGERGPRPLSRPPSSLSSFFFPSFSRSRCSLKKGKKGGEKMPFAFSFIGTKMGVMAAPKAKLESGERDGERLILFLRRLSLFSPPLTFFPPLSLRRRDKKKKKKNFRSSQRSSNASAATSPPSSATPQEPQSSTSSIRAPPSATRTR